MLQAQATRAGQVLGQRFFFLLPFLAAATPSTMTWSPALGMESVRLAPASPTIVAVKCLRRRSLRPIWFVPPGRAEMPNLVASCSNPARTGSLGTVYQRSAGSYRNGCRTMSSSSGPQQSEYRGSALSFGLVLLMWGAFLYFYPPSANLPSWMQTLALFLAFICFILGAITAGAGISDFRQNLFMTHFSIALALALIAYAVYFLSERLVDRPDLSLAARIAVIPAAQAAILMFGESITQILTGQSDRQGEQSGLSTESSGVNRIPPRTDGTARFERIAGAAIAFVSLAAAIMALVNEIRRGP